MIKRYADFFISVVLIPLLYLRRNPDKLRKAGWKKSKKNYKLSMSDSRSSVCASAFLSSCSLSNVDPLDLRCLQLEITL